MPEPTRTYILNDKPVESIRDDALDFTPYVQALADIIMTGSTPLTIGVFGTWGSGKTSLMRMVMEQVETQGAITGWFDAWKYDKEETLWRAFLLSVLFAIRKSTKEGEPTDDLDYLETMLYRAIDLEKSGGVTIDLAKLGGKLAQGAVQIGLSFIPGGAALGKIVEELQKVGTENLSQGALDAIQRERSKIHIEQVRFLEQFQDKFRALVQQHVMNNGGRLVVLVDDLDRCLPEKAIEVLEAIKLFVDASGCVFVLGLDQEVIARGVELRYRDFSRNDGGKRDGSFGGIKYLEKIIQLPFHIPPIEQQDMDVFVKALIKNWPHPDCPVIFSEAMPDNPRQIKRAINAFLLLLRLARIRNLKSNGNIEPLRLAKIVAIQSIFPNLYEVFKSKPALLPKLEIHFRNKEKVEAGVVPQSEIEILPDELLPYGGNIILSRILTMHKLDMPGANFSTLSPDEIWMYFTLTYRVESPYSTSEYLKIPMLGRIGASLPMPVPASDFNYYDIEAGVEIARSLLPPKIEGLFALEVQGDSMIDAMVNDGDIVVMGKVNNNSEVKNGDMVAAWLPKRDETVLTYFYREQDTNRLQPANPTMEPIYIDKSERIEIKGKVVMVVRKIDKK